MLTAQETAKIEPLPMPYRTVGINTTPLLVQLIPFNRSNPRVTGPYYMTWRSYRINRRGQVGGFRMALGADLSDVDDESFQAFINFRFGWERKKVIHERWSYSSGLDFMIFGGDLNIPGGKDQDAAGFGFGPVWGIEYDLARHVSLSIETALFIGTAAESGFKLEFIPPVSIYMNFKIPKKKR